MIIKKPADCTKEELEQFKTLVLEGKQVEPDGLEDRIKTCRLLGFFYDDNNELVGVSAVKNKSRKSVTAVKARAKASDGIYPEFELGYSFTKKTHRGKGINPQLNDKLLEEMGEVPMYATTDNNTMRRYLQSKGFVKKGESFKGRYNENLDYFEKM